MCQSKVTVNSAGYSEELYHFFFGEFEVSLVRINEPGTMSSENKISVIITNLKKFAKMVSDWVSQNRIEVDIEKNAGDKTKKLHIKCPPDRMSKEALEQAIIAFVEEDDNE